MKPRPSPDYLEAVRRFDCSFCGAKKGQPCTTRSGNPRHPMTGPHDSRMRLLWGERIRSER